MSISIDRLRTDRRLTSIRWAELALLRLVFLCTAIYSVARYGISIGFILSMLGMALTRLSGAIDRLMVAVGRRGTDH